MKISCVRGLASQSRVVLGLLSLMICSLASAAGPGWYNNFEQAVQAARQQGRPIFVDFSTSWCSVCKQMDRTTLADPVILARLENFIKVKVDGDAFPQLCQAYGVEAYPTFVHLDSNGRMIDKRVGGMRVQEMASALDNTLRSVSTSMAIAQANQAEAQRTAAAAQGTNQVQIASADMNLSVSRETEENSRTVSREVTRQGARDTGRSAAPTAPSAPSLYNMGDSQLQGSAVYATEPGEAAARRSRFGGMSNGGLKELAEATAQPNDTTESADSNAEADKAESEGTDEPDEKESRSDAKSEKTVAAAESTSEKKTSRAGDESKTAGRADSSETRSVATSANALAEKARSAAASSESPSPVIESRLAGISSESLPRPLLNRTAPGATQALAPAPSAESVSQDSSVKMVSNDPLSSVRKMQRDDKGQSLPSISKESVEIAAAKPAEKTVSDRIEQSKKTEKPRETAKTTTSKKPDSEKPETTSEGATREDIERWIKDADTKLVEAHKTDNVQRKREARAMYNKVVENDPNNKFGRSDMAFIKMVSLIVDRDSDLLRRQAYNKIKEFEEKFPDSGHKDYYTLIRAILAADLGENGEAHQLLSDYSEKFPDSKYGKMAEETRKSLPASSKSSKKSSAATSSKKSKSRNS